VVETRKRRANGETSRQRILDAASAIAGERGFEGTTINLVSERSGLPASSIYWHFKDKDELIAAVIDHSWDAWIERIDRPLAVPDGVNRMELFRIALQQTRSALEEFPDFLRLGLMLILEHRAEDPTARAKFIEVREATAERIRRAYELFFVDLSGDDVASLVTLTIALADGLFVAREANELELTNAFDLMTHALLGAAEQLATRTENLPPLHSTRRSRPHQ
jgi:AcrR family transcriptional regulator